MLEPPSEVRGVLAPLHRSVGGNNVRAGCLLDNQDGVVGEGDKGTFVRGDGRVRRTKT